MGKCVLMNFNHTRKEVMLFITCFKNSFNILLPQKDKEKEEKQLEEVIVTKLFVVQVLLSIKRVEEKLISTATTMSVECVCVKGVTSLKYKITCK